MYEDHRGTNIVKTDVVDKAEIRVWRKVKGRSKQKADELFKNHEVTFDQDGNNVSVVAKNKTQLRSFSFKDQNLEVRYEISIPKKFDVDLKTSGGDIGLADLEGKATTRTSSGSIKAGHITGQVSSANSGGDISIKEAGGALSARTSSGSVEVSVARGKAEMSNSGGNIKLSEGNA